MDNESVFALECLSLLFFCLSYLLEAEKSCGYYFYNNNKNFGEFFQKKYNKFSEGYSQKKVFMLYYI